ncbi:MAG TPA: hypothetical protein DDW52_17015 [Planctomycetaceae bacterium]|nr:hypothetical protein [Planctomycetaceae bacterium]
MEAHRLIVAGYYLIFLHVARRGSHAAQEDHFMAKRQHVMPLQNEKRRGATQCTPADLVFQILRRLSS